MATTPTRAEVCDVYGAYFWLNAIARFDGGCGGGGGKSIVKEAAGWLAGALLPACLPAFYFHFQDGVLR